MIDNGEVHKLAPGILGSVVAILWMRDTPVRLIAAAVGGSTASYYGAAALAAWIAPRADIVGFVGFLMGVFGMAIGSKIFETIQSFDLKARVGAWLDRRGW